MTGLRAGGNIDWPAESANKAETAEVLKNLEVDGAIEARMGCSPYLGSRLPRSHSLLAMPASHEPYQTRIVEPGGGRPANRISKRDR